MLESKPGNTETQPIDSTAEQFDGNERVESLMEYEDREMQIRLLDLEDQGISGIQNADDNSGLDTESIETVKKELAIQEKVSGISGRARDLYEKTKLAMKRVVAVGMATMTISGCAGKLEGNTDSLTNEELNIEKVDGVPYGEKAREQMIAMTRSPTYLERLAIETDGDIEEAKRIQQERIKNLEEVDIEYFKDIASLNKNLVSRNIVTNFGSSKAAGCTILPEEPDKPMEILVTEDKIGEAIHHELDHVSNMGGDNIPTKTLSKLEKLVSGKNYGFLDTYIKSPTEILARKRTIDMKMEELGIKKYGEKFKQEHLEKLVEIEKAQIGVKTDEELKEFFLNLGDGIIPAGIEFTTLYGIENIEELFNEIANNEGSTALKDIQSRTA